MSYFTFTIIHVSVPLIWKLTPYILNIFVLFLLVFTLNLFNVRNQFISFYFSNMMMLSCFIITLISNIFLHLSFKMCKSSEYGAFRSFLNSSTERIISSLSLLFFKIFSLNSLNLVIMFSLLFVFLYILLSNIT